GAAAVPGAAALVHAGAAPGRREGMRRTGRMAGWKRAWRAGLLLAAGTTGQAQAQDVLATRLHDGFDDPRTWTVVASDQVEAGLRTVEGATGGAPCLDYDFKGVSCHAGQRRPLPLELPGNYRFDLLLREI